MFSNKFKRYDGFAGHIPQKFIDAQLPRCPMCCGENPHWTLSSEMGWVANRHLFKCAECSCVISSGVAETLGWNRTILTTGGLIKALSGKKNNVIYFRVEQVGEAQATDTFKGREMPLEELQELSKLLGS